MFYRPITTSEKLYIVENDINQALSLQLVVEMRAEIHTDSLSEAIVQASKANPCVNYRVKLNPFKSYWYKSNANYQDLSVFHYEWDGENIQSIPFLHNLKFNPKEPAVHISYIKGTRHFIIFRVFHGLMDAMGLYHWVKDIFRAWCSKDLIGSNEKITDFDFLMKHRKKQYRAHFSLDCIPPTNATNKTHTNYIWYKLKVPFTINALTAKLCQILLENSIALGAEKARFMIPVDLRKYLPSENTTSNFANPLFVEFQKETSWQSIYSDLVKQLANQNELMIGKHDGNLRYVPKFILKKLLKTLSHYQIKKNRYMISGIISSMVIDLNDLQSNNNKATDAFFLPINTSFSPITVITTEHNDATTICFSISNAHASQEDCIDLSNKFTRIIKSEEKALCDTLWPEYNATEINYPQNKTTFARIWDKLTQNPHQTILICGETHITCQQIQERVLALATHFSNLGATKGSLIALILANNQDNICCILACWYLGAAYIPIDAKSPYAWILTILANAKPQLTVHDKKNTLHDYYSGLCTSTLPETCEGNIPSMESGSLSQLAYIIYTSGSTGTPKGVMINHGQLLNYLWWALEAYQQNNQPYHTALFTCIAFDLTVTTLYLPLITGGSIRLINQQINPLTLKNIISNSSINFVKLTPSHLRMISCLPFSSENQVTLVVGGETLSCQLAKAIQEKLPFARIFNEYGPTETTVGCMIHLYNQHKDLQGSVPIGIPAANTRIYCLDKQLKPVKIGQEGELYIAGNGVGVGYLNNPKSTDLSFLNDPFHPDQRMYKSGDLAMHQDDGLIICLGRADQQVKIRGHRIELSEIENTLLLIDDIMQAIVISRKISTVHNELIAYIVSSQKLAPELIQAQLSSMLPYYMVPRHIISLSEIPMTINGKVDIKQLPVPQEECIDTTDIKNNDLLLLIQQSFANVLALSINDVATDSIFHELGGDSMQMAALINELLTKIIPSQHHNTFMAELEPLLSNATPNNFYQCMVNLLQDTLS